MTNSGLSLFPWSRVNDTAILVPSWDGYQDVWDPFFHCFFKYWPDCPYPVFLGTNELRYPDPRVQSIPVGPDEDYSSNLLKMLNALDQEWVIIWVEDFFLHSKVETGRVECLVELAKKKQVSSLCLDARRYSIMEASPKCQNLICSVSKRSLYQVSISTTLWSKDILLSLVRPGETAWHLERFGSIRSRDLARGFFCLHSRARSDPPLPTVNGVIGGEWTLGAVSLLSQEGLQAYLDSRPCQSRVSFFLSRLRSWLRFGLFRVFPSLGSAIAKSVWDSDLE